MKIFDSMKNKYFQLVSKYIPLSLKLEIRLNSHFFLLKPNISEFFNKGDCYLKVLLYELLELKN